MSAHFPIPPMQREGHVGGSSQADILQLTAKRPLIAPLPSRAADAKRDQCRALDGTGNRGPAPMVARCEDNKHGL